MESTPHSKLYSDVSNSPRLTMQHSSCCCCSSFCGGGLSVGNGGFGFIEHTVSKFDTLAGVAIKYGVEVADIKRMNSLTTDLQMFALKSLKIPLPGRHPPSPIMSNGYDTQRSETTPPNRRYSDSFESIKSLKLSSSYQRDFSPSMNTLRGYYSLTPKNQNEGFEMTQIPKTPLGLPQKSKSVANGFSVMCSMNNTLVANEKTPGSHKSIEKNVRRRKSEVDLKNHSPENPPTRTIADPDPVDSLISDTFTGVRKSSSAPSFQHSDNNNNNNTDNNSIGNSNSSSGNGNGNGNGNSLSLLSMWPTSVLNLTADIQALSTSAITRPVFDGFSKLIGGRKKE